MKKLLLCMIALLIACPTVQSMYPQHTEPSEHIVVLTSLKTRLLEFRRELSELQASIHHTQQMHYNNRYSSYGMSIDHTPRFNTINPQIMDIMGALDRYCFDNDRTLLAGVQRQYENPSFWGTPEKDCAQLLSLTVQLIEIIEPILSWHNRQHFAAQPSFANASAAAHPALISHDGLAQAPQAFTSHWHHENDEHDHISTQCSPTAALTVAAIAALLLIARSL